MQADFDTCAVEEAHAWDLADGQYTCHREDDDKNLAADAEGAVGSPCRLGVVVLLLSLEDWGRVVMVVVVVVVVAGRCGQLGNSPAWFVIPDSPRPAARLDMRLAVDGFPTVEADTVPGCLDRLTLAGCTDGN